LKKLDILRKSNIKFVQSGSNFANMKTNKLPKLEVSKLNKKHTGRNPGFDCVLASKEDILLEDILIVDVLLEDVLLEDVLLEDVLLEDVLLEDILLEDVLLEDILLEDLF
jgi:hypothetical protein